MHYKRKLVQALVGVILGAGLIAAGVVTAAQRVPLLAAGAVITLLSLVWAVVSWRRHLVQVRPARARAKKTKGTGQARAGSRRPGQTRRARMMERMEERWRRRQEGNRRM